MENVEQMTYEELKKHEGTIIKELELKIKEFEQWSEDWKARLGKYFNEETVERLISNASSSFLRCAKSVRTSFKEMEANLDNLAESEILSVIEDIKARVGKITSVKKIMEICEEADRLPPEEIKKRYLALDNNAENRYKRYTELANSTHADIFVPLILGDVEKMRGGRDSYYETSRESLMPKAMDALMAKKGASTPQNGESSGPQNGE